MKSYNITDPDMKSVITALRLRRLAFNYRTMPDRLSEKELEEVGFYIELFGGVPKPQQKTA